MKTIETTVYTVAELKEQFPDGYKAAFEHFQRQRMECGEVFWQSEIMDSLKAIVAACGMKMSKWDLGDSSNRRQDITLDYRHNEAAQELSGKRAMAFFWHALKEHGYSRPTFPGWKMEFPGTYGFTGYCADEDFAESIWQNLQTGDTLKEAIEDQARTYGKLLDAEIEQMQSEEEFEVWADGQNFTEEGETF